VRGRQADDRNSAPYTGHPPADASADGSVWRRPARHGWGGGRGHPFGPAGAHGHLPGVPQSAGRIGLGR